MADQEFLVSFGVDIDESGLDKMQQALQQNADLADSLASAFDSARGSIASFFDQLSASTLSTGEASPWQKLQDLSSEGISISIELDFTNAQKDLDSFLETAEEPVALTADAADLLTKANDALSDLELLFTASELPLIGEASGVKTAGGDALSDLETLYAATNLPLSAEASGVDTAGSGALDALSALYSATLLALKADASAVVSAGSAALDQLKSLYSSTVLTVKATVVTDGSPTGGGNPTGGGENGNPTGEGTPTGGETHGPKVPGSPFEQLLGAATGGRFTSPTQAEIAEDGDPEYVIPVKKESLALPLLRQLIGELSDSARETLRNDLGEKSPAAESLSGLPSLLSSARGAAAPVITQNSVNSVQAPVTIEVHAAGSNPEDIGQSIYDVTERYLIRTLQGVI